MLSQKNIVWLVFVVALAMITQFFSCGEPCGLKREPILYLSNNSNLTFTKIYSPQAIKNNFKIEDQKLFKLPISLIASSTTFLLEDIQGQTHSISISYELISEFQSNICGYVINIKNFAIAEPTTLTVHIESGYYTGGGWFGGNYIENDLYAVIDP